MKNIGINNEIIKKEKLISQVEAQCNKTKKLLGFEQILNSNTHGIINKILDTNFLKYKVEIGTKINYLEYINFLNKEIVRLFLEEDILSIENILQFHKSIFSIYNKKELKANKITKAGRLRKFESNSFTLDKNGNKIITNYFMKKELLKKEFIKLITEYNLFKNETKLIDIVILFNTTISKIHPFENGNGRVFFTLLDILLLKNNYLPLFINQEKKEYNKILNKYFINYNLKELENSFLILILNKYKKYNIQ